MKTKSAKAARSPRLRPAQSGPDPSERKVRVGSKAGSTSPIRPPRQRPQSRQAPAAKGAVVERAEAGLTFEVVPIDVLRLSKRRLSQPNDRQHRQLMSSITTFGFIAPLVVTGDNEVIVGEKRLAAARELGFAKVPVVRAHDLTSAQVSQYRIADNKLNALRRWDADALREELEEIIVLDPDVNIEAMGFDVAEFDVALEVVTEGADPADLAPEPPHDALSREGDIWEVDGHRVGCGDARDGDFMQRVLDGAEVACVFADPPWNQKVAGHMGGKGRIKHEEFIMFSGSESDAEFEQFQIDWLKQAAAVARPGALIYVASDWQALSATLGGAKAAGLEQISFAVWKKDVPALGSFYRSAVELFPIWRKPGGKHRNNVMLGRNGRHRSTCWEYPGASSFGPARDALKLHPTSKPLHLVGDILLDCTARGEVVLDPFSGSGTTLIAAQRTGRRARVIELDPRYVDVAVRRYQDLFGRAPRLARSGLTLDELAAMPPRPRVSVSPISKKHQAEEGAPGRGRKRTRRRQ